jgi:hypothetical protein
VSRRLEHADQRGLRRGHVLLIEDCSEVKFPTTAQRRRGLGPVKKGNACGVLVHAMLAVDATSGYCLGPVGGDAWSRDGMNPVPHSHRPLAEREAAQVTVVVGGPRGRHVPVRGDKQDGSRIASFRNVAGSTSVASSRCSRCIIFGS